MKEDRSSIQLEKVTVDFPVFHAASLSLKNRVLSSLTGGLIDRKHDGTTVIRGLHDITLKIGSGERVGLIGGNGSGKTTLLRVLSGIYWPTSGEVRISGECISLINISLGIDAEATGRENIRLRAAMMGIPPNELRGKIDSIIDFSGLGDFIDMPFRTYSAGMQLRLAFSVSTSIRPQILLLDEWLSTGDEDFKHRAEQRLRDVVDAADILVIASHSESLLRQTCDRVVWLEHGLIKRDGPTDQTLNEYFHRAVT